MTAAMHRGRVLGALASSATIFGGVALSTAASSFDLPRESAVPGGIAIIRLEQDTGPMPDADAAGHRILVISAGTAWVAVVGIPLSAAPGVGRLRVGGAGAREIDFSIGGKQYASQSLRVPRHQVDLSQADLARVADERLRIDHALEKYSEPAPESLRFAQPVPGPRSRSFGMRRLFNGESRNPHSGMDISAPIGTPISVPIAGTILDTGNFFFNGNTVIVDHGRGFISMYCHLSRIDVEPGQRISAGAQLGAVGATGRVTGPHLHWGLSLNHVWVDPELFVR